MIKVKDQNTSNELSNKDGNSGTSKTASDNNEQGDGIHSTLEQMKPCGRSYSSAKALKDHIKTVHTDTNIYSCHVSRFCLWIYPIG